MVEYGKILGDALRFGVEPRRWLPVLVLDAVAFLLAFSYLMSNALAIQQLVQGNINALLMASSVAGMVGMISLVFIIWSLLRLYIVGALIHQSVKPKEYDKSWKVSKERYGSILGVGIVVGVISGIVSMVPYVGWVFSIIVSLMFFFAMQIAIAKKSKFDEALRESYGIFRKETVNVFIAWILTSILGGVIIMVFMIPMMATIWSIMLPAMMTMQANSNGIEVLSMLIMNGWTVVPAAIVYLVGLAYVTVFSANAQTNFYLKMKK
ncbi:MAG: hypothetical protein JW716_00310 [Candidatus Aenigmarchaeota archaeon]|nr:hypothetical protein [Candidatus Aenigmarchaeota archaeon]